MIHVFLKKQKISNKQPNLPHKRIRKRTNLKSAEGRKIKEEINKIETKNNRKD